jgi:hypothetical protein
MLKSFTSTIMVFGALFFTGCLGGASNELDGLNENEYQIVKERQDFEKKTQADINFDIESGTNENVTLLMDAHVTVMYRVALQDIKEITNIRLQEKKHLNINKLLIATKDYYYDSVNNALYVALRIPYVYMLESSFTYTMDIAMVDIQKLAQQRSLSLVFKSKPMSDNDESFLSFTYEDSFLSDNIDPFILNTIEAERAQTNLGRFSVEYRTKYEELLGEL